MPSERPEAALPTGESIYRVVCDQHNANHMSSGGWYDNAGVATRAIESWWKVKQPGCTGWRVEVRRLSPWEPSQETAPREAVPDAR